VTAHTTRSRSAVTSFVVASRYMPVYIALVLLLVVALIWAPSMLSRTSLIGITPAATFLAVAALGQMLVIMTGGIDLSVPGTFTLSAAVVIGVGYVGPGATDPNAKVAAAVLTAIGVAALIGLVNGILIGVLKLNPLIVTLAVGQIVIGIASQYIRGLGSLNAPPPGLSGWLATRHFGLTRVFWIGVLMTLVLVFVFRYTTLGRRFQAVGANPTAANVNGLRVNVNQIAAYVFAAVLFAIAGILLAALRGSPGVGAGAPYLLGPIAAVVIGGASLSGGLASPVSTWAAAMFLGGLDFLMVTIGLPSALQYVVFGLVIIGGMLISGDRIIKGVERVLRERRRRPRDGQVVMRETG